ncbi:hypothetical protein AB0J83_41935 [Actinoplanes sp. NPDC049596]|uniref:hypothetical protein n=1 Tax=unclassified Actinoplanes TaxID=2626549 RepID=UPI003417C47C
MRARLPTTIEIEPLGEDRCAFIPGSDDPAMPALWLGFLGAGFEVVDAPELLAAVHGLASRYAAVTAARWPRDAPGPTNADTCPRDGHSTHGDNSDLTMKVPQTKNREVEA